MPGSLLLSHDNRSDLSDISARSLDSKLNGKKVSFNKAVRVKQYPWKPDFETSNAEHLTLPNNRFWFKVYKSKHDTSQPNDNEDVPYVTAEWEEENMDCIPDSLAPIAEVEDQDLDMNHLEQDSRNQQVNGWNNYDSKNQSQTSHFTSNGVNDYNFHPLEPPVDYFDDMHLGKSHAGIGSKPVWQNYEPSSDQYTSPKMHLTNSILWNRNILGKRHESIPEMDGQAECSSLHSHTTANSILNNTKVPHVVIRNESTTRRSLRKWPTPDNEISRERRSRSHDEYLDNDKLKLLRKADKSVSTDDLNSVCEGSSHSNRLFRSSRDMATQCYGTLSRNKNAPLTNNNSDDPVFIRTSYNSGHSSNGVEIRSSKSSMSRTNLCRNGLKNNAAEGYLKKETNTGGGNRFPGSNCSYLKPIGQAPAISVLNGKTANCAKYESQTKSKVNPVKNNIFARNENAVPDQTQKLGSRPFRGYSSRIEAHPTPSVNSETRKNRENIQSQGSRNSATVGYVRGKQIPLSEVNTNTNRKLLSRNDARNNRNLISSQVGENVKVMHSSLSPRYNYMSEASTSNGARSKKVSSPTIDSNSERNYKTDSNSAKIYTPSYCNDNNSGIDWSLSGFQLAPKPEQRITSVSDSEYTVHRRPPLLMYIPGVSHHDRPAVEDDRLSALSDLSRSEINDGLGSLLTSTAKTGNSHGDLRRRHSMPRDGKLKWMKWKSKG